MHASISDGPSPSLALQIQQNPKLPEGLAVLRRAVAKFLELPGKKVPELSIREKDNKKIIELENDRDWYLAPDEYEAVLRFARDDNWFTPSK